MLYLEIYFGQDKKQNTAFDDQGKNHGWHEWLTTLCTEYLIREPSNYYLYHEVVHIFWCRKPRHHTADQNAAPQDLFDPVPA